MTAKTAARVTADVLRERPRPLLKGHVSPAQKSYLKAPSLKYLTDKGDVSLLVKNSQRGPPKKLKS
jgi:hypothetical protein